MVDCDAGEEIQQKIALAKPGDTVLVSGTCRENLAISSEVVRITLDDQEKAVIQAPVPQQMPSLSAARTLQSRGSRSLAGGTAFICPVPPRVLRLPLTGTLSSVQEDTEFMGG